MVNGFKLVCIKTMSRPRPIILLILVIVSFSVSSTADLTYYLAPVSGDDHNPGTWSSQPWKTLARAGEHIYAPGESLLLKADKHVVGILALQGGGTAENQVLIGRYGNGAMPAIDGEGVRSAAIQYNPPDLEPQTDFIRDMK